MHAHAHAHAHTIRNPWNPLSKKIPVPFGAAALGGKVGQWVVCLGLANTTSARHEVDCMNAYSGVIWEVVKVVWYPHRHPHLRSSLPSQKGWVIDSVYSQDPSLCSIDTFFHSLLTGEARCASNTTPHLNYNSVAFSSLQIGALTSASNTMLPLVTSTMLFLNFSKQCYESKILCSATPLLLMEDDLIMWPGNQKSVFIQPYAVAALMHLVLLDRPQPLSFLIFHDLLSLFRAGFCHLFKIIDWTPFLL